MNAREIQFGKVPTQVIRTGALANLSRSELLVYLTIAAFLDGHTWTTCVAVETVARINDISDRTVQRAVKKLLFVKLIILVRRGGGTRASEYRLATAPPPAPSPTPLEPGTADTRAQAATPSDKPDREIRQSAHPLMPRPRPKPDCLSVTQFKDQRIKETAAAAGDLTKNEANLEAARIRLAVLGIGNPTRDHLLQEFTGVTVAEINMALEGLRPDAGPGLIVLRLRERLSEVNRRRCDLDHLEKRLSAILQHASTMYHQHRPEVDALLRDLRDPDPWVALSLQRLSRELGSTREAPDAIRRWHRSTCGTEDAALRWLISETLLVQNQTLSARRSS